MSQHKIDAFDSGTAYNGMDWEAEYVITFNYRAASRPRISGPPEQCDPGWAAEIEFVSITPGAGDHGAFSDIAQKHLEEWAEGWLDDHLAECIELAEAANDPDPDYLRDRRVDDRLTGDDDSF